MKSSDPKKAVWINGLSGRMGQDVASRLEESCVLRLIGGSDHDTSKLYWDKVKSAAVIIDFSTVGGNQSLLKKASELTSRAFLIGTTGLPAATLKKWQTLADKNKHLVLLAPNTSLGVYTLSHHVGSLAKALTAANWDIEIIETHHNRKADAPSGTALFLARMIQKECPDHKIDFGREGKRKPRSIGMHAVRGGGVFGEHEIRFIGEHEEIYVGHRAFSRALFAQGAVGLAERLAKTKKSGLVTIENF